VLLGAGHQVPAVEQIGQRPGVAKIEGRFVQHLSLVVAHLQVPQIGQAQVATGMFGIGGQAPIEVSLGSVESALTGQQPTERLQHLRRRGAA
jgi:xanthine dehydrogenase iron-sulfur cluster and FAD-binding subunit A